MAGTDHGPVGVGKWLARETGEDKAVQVIAFTQICRVVALDTEIALAAAEACRDYELATAHAIIYATAQADNAVLVTCDRHFQPSACRYAIEKTKC